jgi:hypothetical protein
VIEPLTGFAPDVVAFACRGQVTGADYEQVLIPAVEKALAEQPKVRLYYEIAPDFTGIEPGAVFNDFKVGMAHLPRWERIAVVTDIAWIRHTMLAFSFLLPGRIKLFHLDEAAAARAWIAARP